MPPTNSSQVTVHVSDDDGIDIEKVYKHTNVNIWMGLSSLKKKATNNKHNQVEVGKHFYWLEQKPAEKCLIRVGGWGEEN